MGKELTPIIELELDDINRVMDFLKSRKLMESKTGRLVHKPVNVALGKAILQGSGDNNGFTQTVDYINGVVTLHKQGFAYRLVVSDVSDNLAGMGLTEVNNEVNILRETINFTRMISARDEVREEKLKEACCYLMYKQFEAVMMFMEYATELVEQVDIVKKENGKTKKKNSSSKKSTAKVKILRKFRIKQFETSTSSKSSRKSLDHEFNVRGHWREYSSGKRIWINQFAKCKGKEQKQTIYKL